ncbi:uncharacterized protein LOC119519012 isoform X4 [Choloepus didactylus]|uniref:uncharacterized protein LOC119519012 isoform X4 n=1 Tax=Choloepus didactylus TaxID=27675 RepID=UPI00189DB17A|nr:uncharacterized protein LOC119519012 isoform X4 [Choloepus didactylus]
MQKNPHLGNFSSRAAELPTGRPWPWLSAQRPRVCPVLLVSHTPLHGLTSACEQGVNSPNLQMGRQRPGERQARGGSLLGCGPARGASPQPRAVPPSLWQPQPGRRQPGNPQCPTSRAASTPPANARPDTGSCQVPTCWLLANYSFLPDQRAGLLHSGLNWPAGLGSSAELPRPAAPGPVLPELSSKPPAAGSRPRPRRTR